MSGGSPPPLPKGKPVGWFQPSVLAHTGLQALLAAVFARFADKREQQAGIEAGIVDLWAEEPDLWVDYVSDLGDGFDATTTIAHLLARPRLDLPVPGEPVPRSTPRGAILVMGGDQVYPFAAIAEYEKRLVAPYRAVLPTSDPPHPVVVAIPGNHDWYDGLTAFLRVFAQRLASDDVFGRWFAGWRTVQKRSYFAVRLPHGWWLWGIDIQLDTYIDGPQIEYFSMVGKSLQAGDAVILSCAKPSWLAAGPQHPEAYSVLDFFERELITPTGATLRLSLTGDHHSYVRYHHPNGEQKIMAGGGGAYLAATHHFPDQLHLPPPDSTDPGKTPTRVFNLATQTVDGTEMDTRYPSRAQSKQEARGFVRILWRNGIWFLVILGIAYAACAAVARSSGWFPWMLIPAILLVLALGAFTKSHGGVALRAGSLHAAGHLFAVAGVLAIEPSMSTLATAGATGVVGMVIGPLVVGLYLFVADKRRINTNELFAGQRIERYRCFLRMHLRPDSDLVVYAVGVDDVCGSWTSVPVVPGEPTVQPAQPIAFRLIDGPVTITRTGQGT